MVYAVAGASLEIPDGCYSYADAGARKVMTTTTDVNCLDACAVLKNSLRSNRHILVSMCFLKVNETDTCKGVTLSSINPDDILDCELQMDCAYLVPAINSTVFSKTTQQNIMKYVSYSFETPAQFDVHDLMLFINASHT